MKELAIIDLENINPQNKSDLRKLFNNVEDMCYYYNSDDVSDDTKKNIEIQLIDVCKWVNKNKEEIGNYPNKYYDIFKNIQSDLNKIDDLVAKVITPIYNETLYNWLDYFKSSGAFYDVKGNHNSGKNDIDLLIKNANKSVKMEKIASYTLYIVSGKATDDYIPNATGLYYKNKAAIATNKKDLDLISTYPYDGHTEDFILFATSNTNTQNQDIFKAIKKNKDSKILFVYAPYFNQKHSYIETEYAGRKAQQHGVSFLKKFNDDFNHSDLGDFNLLPFMSLLSNIKVPEDNDINISEILKVNPFAIGTDTYHVYKDFRDLNEYEEPQKTEKLLEYTVDYIHGITNRLKTINNNFEFDEVTLSIFNNTQNILLAALRNFNKSNLLNEIPNNTIIEKLYECINNYNIAYNKSSRENKVSNELNKGNDQLSEISDIDDILYKYKKRNKNIEKKYEYNVENKVELSDYSLEKYKSVFESINLPSIDIQNFCNMIKNRQIDSKHNVFNSDTKHYAFYIGNRDKEAHKEIFKFIENNTEFNNPDNINYLLDKIDNINETFDLIKPDNVVEEVWKSKSGGRYKIPVGITHFFNEVKKAGDEGISFWRMTERSKTFYRSHVYFRNNPSSKSFFSRSNKTDSDKSKASSSLLEAFGLYDDKTNFKFSDMIEKAKIDLKKNNILRRIKI